MWKTRNIVALVFGTILWYGLLPLSSLSRGYSLFIPIIAGFVSAGVAKDHKFVIPIVVTLLGYVPLNIFRLISEKSTTNSIVFLLLFAPAIGITLALLGAFLSRLLFPEK